MTIEKIAEAAVKVPLCETVYFYFAEDPRKCARIFVSRKEDDFIHAAWNLKLCHEDIECLKINATRVEWKRLQSDKENAFRNGLKWNTTTIIKNGVEEQVYEIPTWAGNC